jgi:hypothetical protein
LGGLKPTILVSKSNHLPGFQWRVGKAEWGIEKMRCLGLAILWPIKDGNSTFRRIDDSAREMTGMSLLAIVERMSKLTGQIWRENSMRSTTVEGGPTISRIRYMDMKKRNRGSPSDHPCQDQQMAIQQWSNWKHQPSQFVLGGAVGAFCLPMRRLLERKSSHCPSRQERGRRESAIGHSVRETESRSFL